LIKWANGSITQFGHCNEAQDANNYLSSEYDLISFDEVVTFERDQVMLISSRARTTKEGVVPQVVCGTNPGGPQSAWVKEWYIDRTVDRNEYPDYDPANFLFIPSLLQDNPYVDKGYARQLANLPPMLRKAYRDGSWDIWPGQYFEDWDRARHIVERPGWSPRGLKVYAGIDWGYIRPGACLWIAIDGEGHAYAFDEFMFKSMIASDVATEIKRRSKDWGIKPHYIADTQMWMGQDQTGETMAETFIRMGVGVVQATKDRINGWQRMRAWLRDAPDGKPWFTISPICAYLARTMPQLQQDASNPEDVESSGPDHCADAARYAFMARPSPGSISKHTAFPSGSLGWLLARDRASVKTGLLTQRSR
jgi:hypothetical protein